MKSILSTCLYPISVFIAQGRSYRLHPCCSTYTEPTTHHHTPCTKPPNGGCSGGRGASTCLENQRPRQLTCWYGSMVVLLCMSLWWVWGGGLRNRPPPPPSSPAASHVLHLHVLQSMRYTHSTEPAAPMPLCLRVEGGMPFPHFPGGG